MVLIFFIGVWGVLLAILTRLSKTHSWILCVFAVGLGCPRWCQMLWGTSSLARAYPAFLYSLSLPRFLGPFRSRAFPCRQCTSRGLAPSDLTSAPASGSGSESSTRSRALDSA